MPEDTPMTSAQDASPTGSNEPAASQPSTCFSCRRLNPSTFLIVEDDQWGEQPFIYVKIYSHLVVLIDTGCGGAARDSSVELRSLRHYIETYEFVDGNDGSPLNPGGEKGYAVVCTHCHYDHIGAIAQFTDQSKCSIWASANDRSFVLNDLPTTSLCRFVGMATPKYEITHWASDGEQMKFSRDDGTTHDLGLIIYHTPGHTPDELAVWDPEERFLYVGDTMYEWAPIIFPLEGDLHKYNSTLYKLRDLIKSWNQGVPTEQRVRMACGHVTSAADAEEFVQEVETFLSKVRRGLIEPQEKGETRGIRLVGYERDDGRISFLGPKRLFDDFSVSDCPV